MQTPFVQINKRAHKRWKRQHPWIYRSDIQKVEAVSGDIVNVFAPDKRHLGYAFYSEKSEISIRRVSRDQEPPNDETWRARLLQAQARRERLLPAGTSVYRLIHGEADGFPATIIDRYGDIFVMQTLCPSSEGLRDLLVELLKEHFSPRAIVERNDGKVRDLEGLPRRKGVVYGELPAVMEIDVDGLQCSFEPLEGQKTGAFLDQLTTLRRCMEFVPSSKRVLEACCYQGWFSCHAASRLLDGGSVTAVDISKSAIEVLRRNAALNDLSSKITAIGNNVFEQLRTFDRDNEQFDLIFLDPPSFIKNRSAKEAGLRGYKELNLRSLRLLPPGGILVSSSCSYHLDRETFWGLVQEAAADQHMDVQLLDIWGQGPDHPCMSNFAESDYLKTLVLQRLS